MSVMSIANLIHITKWQICKTGKTIQIGQNGAVYHTAALGYKSFRYSKQTEAAAHHTAASMELFILCGFLFFRVILV